MTPIEMMLEGVTWVENPNPPRLDGGATLYATHEGVFDLMGHKMRCYRLNNGQAVFDANDFEAFFADLGDDAASSESSPKEK